MRDSSISPTTTLEAPTNCWTLNKRRIYDVLPTIERYRELVRAADETAAAAITYLNYGPLPADGEAYDENNATDVANISNYGIVRSAPQSPFRLRYTNSDTRESGAVFVEFRRQFLSHAATDSDYFQNEIEAFQNRLGDLPQAIHDTFTASGGMKIRNVAFVDVQTPIWEPTDLQLWNWGQAEMIIEWGEI